VINRTKGLPLWIRGKAITTEEAGKITLGLVSEEWDRIEQIDLNLHGRQYLTDSDIERWSNTLSRRAPYMKSCRIRLKAGRNHAFTHPFLSGNHAPSLIRLSIVDYSIDIGACWLPKLRDLDLETRDPLSNILQALSLMPSLEALTVCNPQPHEALGSDTTYPRVGLKNLKSLSVNMAIRTCSKMLECINPVPGCSISILTRSMSRPEAIEEDVMQPFSNHARKVVGDYSLKNLELHMTSELAVSAHTPGTERPFFRIYICPSHPEGKHHATTVQGFAKAFMFEELSRVTEFKLEFGLHGWRGAALTRSFTPSLDHIKAIRVGQWSLLNLFNAYCADPTGDTPDIFPNLETLQMLDFNIVPVRGKAVTSPRFTGIISVLQFLRDAGRPIRILDLTLCPTPFKPTFQFHEVEKMSGLRIIWRQSRESEVSEYVCGTGHPKELLLWNA